MGVCYPTHLTLMGGVTEKLEVKNFGSLNGGEARGVTRIVASEDTVQVIFHLLRADGLLARELLTLVHAHRVV